MNPRRVVIIPAAAAYEVTRCWDCPHFQEYGAAYQDGNTCAEDPAHYPRTVSGDDIPDWCPKAVIVPNNPLEKIA